MNRDRDRQPRTATATAANHGEGHVGEHNSYCEPPTIEEYQQPQIGPITPSESAERDRNSYGCECRVVEWLGLR